jgi:DNA-directed RNA polymerase specialized sigma24 family protein
VPALDVDRLYSQAVQQWPTVQWPQAAFGQHLGDDAPAYPSDLYLAGAAGHRVDAAWVAIESELGSRVKRVLRWQPTAGAAVEDLWGDTILRTIADDPSRPPLPDGRQPAHIIRYRGLVALVNYLILIAKRVAIQHNRARRPAVPLASAESHGESARIDLPDPRTPPPDAWMNEREVAAAMQRGLSHVYASLSPEQQLLVALVCRDRMKQKDAGALLGWSEFKTSRKLSDALERLRKGMIDLSGVQWTPSLAAAWAGCLAQCWKNLQVPASAASEGLAGP